MKLLHTLDMHQTAELLGCLFPDEEYDRMYEEWLKMKKETNNQSITYGERISTERTIPVTR